MAGPILTRVTDPEPLLTLAEAKAHLRVDHTDEDALITALVQAVTAALDGPQGMYGYPVTSQRWSLSTYGPDSDGYLHLPVTPAASLFSVSYFPQDGGAAVVADDAGELAAWTLRAAETWAYVVPASGTWPALADRPDAVTVVYTAGYAAPFADIKQAARFMLAGMYDNREGQGAGPQVEALVNLRRRWWLS